MIELELTMPISINTAIAGYKRRYKSKKYKQWEQIANIEMNRQTQYEITGDKWLRVEYDFYFPIYNKNGTKKVKDVFNYEKVLTDFLCTRIKGLKDHKIIE